MRRRSEERSYRQLKKELSHCFVLSRASALCLERSRSLIAYEISFCFRLAFFRFPATISEPDKGGRRAAAPHRAYTLICPSAATILCCVR